MPRSKKKKTRTRKPPDETQGADVSFAVVRPGLTKHVPMRLSEEQRDALADEAKRRQTTRAAIMREALDLYFAKARQEAT